MKEDKVLTDIIKKKAFKNFWFCFDYLMVAGYSEADAIEIAMNEFGENGVYSCVAFIGMHKVQKDVIIRLDDVERLCRQSTLKVGFIAEDMIQLTRTFDIYRKWLMTDKFAKRQRELEDTCEKLRFNNLSHETLTFFLNLRKKH